MKGPPEIAKEARFDKDLCPSYAASVQLLREPVALLHLARITSFGHRRGPSSGRLWSRQEGAR